jgi:hypothetical protein
MRNLTSSSGQNSQLVHCWVLVHAGPVDALLVDEGAYIFISINYVHVMFISEILKSNENQVYRLNVKILLGQWAIWELP